MSTLSEASSRTELAERIRRVALDAAPAWGQMTAPRMLAHCADALRMAYGDVTCTPKNVPLARNGLVKRLMLYVLPFPKGAPTAPQLISREVVDGEAEREALIALVARFPDEASRTQWPMHPLFGNMSGTDWARLGYKHLDHHLTQFRV